MSKTGNGNAEHCRELVRANDIDRYLSALLAAKNQHRALFAIYAFDADVSNIAAKVSEPAMGEIRLQWWRDELDMVFGGNCDNHPISSELQPVVHEYDLPKHLFSRLIDAHQFDLYREPMADMEALLAYQTATSTAITDLICRVLIGYDALELEFLIGNAGVARGLGKMLQTLPHQVALKQCFLPADLLQENQLGSGNVLAGDDNIGIRLVLKQIHHLLTDKLQQLRQEQGSLKKPVLPAFFPAALVDLNLKHLTAEDQNPLQRTLKNSQLKMQWALFKKSTFERL